MIGQSFLKVNVLKLWMHDSLFKMWLQMVPRVCQLNSRMNFVGLVGLGWVRHFYVLLGLLIWVGK